MKLIKLVALCTSLFLATQSHAQRNPNNPFDRIGEQHNYILDAFFTDQSHETIGDVITTQTIADYMCSKFRDVDCNTIKQALNNELFRTLKGKTLIESEGFLQDKGYVTARHAFYVQQINDIIENHLQEDYIVCFKAFLELEDQLAIDPQISQAEKNYLYYATSIARYSTKFWKDVETGVARYPSIGNPGGQLPCCSWLKALANADVQGSVTGGVAGGSVGALAAGSCSSIASGASSIWHSLWN